MNKTRNTLLLFFLVFFLSSFENEFQHTLSHFKLWGKVKAISELTVYPEGANKDNPASRSNFKEFNESGNIMLDSIYDGKGSSVTSYYYSKDNDTITTTSAWFMKHPVAPHKTIYTCDSKGRIVMVEDTNSNSTIRLSRLEKYSYRGDSILQYSYEPVGKLSGKVISICNKQGEVLKKSYFNGKGELADKIDYKYDRKRNLIWKNYWSATADMANTDSMAYNDKGDMIYDRSNWPAHKSVVKMEYKYEYDSEGNWVKQYMTVNDSLRQVVTRKIEYYR